MRGHKPVLLTVVSLCSTVLVFFTTAGLVTIYKHSEHSVMNTLIIES